MNNEIWLWDYDNDEWNGNIFYSVEGAEKYVIAHGGYDRFAIFEKLS